MEPNGTDLLNLKNYKQQLPIDICNNGSCRYILKRAMDVINPKQVLPLNNAEEAIQGEDDNQVEEGSVPVKKENSKDSMKNEVSGSALTKPKFTNKAKPLASLKPK